MAGELTTVRTYWYLPEAEAARMHLQEEGINVFLADAETVAMDWLLANAIGAIKLQVPSSAAERAVALLDAIPDSRLLSQDGATEQARCLACGADMPETDWQCPACGWSYAGDEDEF